MASTQTDQVINEGTLCTHCGDSCEGIDIKHNDAQFCCQGCKTVYILLNEKGLEGYYSIEDLPGISFKNKRQKAYDYLVQFFGSERHEMSHHKRGFMDAAKGAIYYKQEAG